MRYATTSLVSSLTGLSTTQLREWTNRRALVPADVPPAGRGSPAKFTWQTVLIICVAATLKTDFRLELQSYRGLFSGLRTSLHQKSFVAIWNKKLVIEPSGDWTLTNIDDDIDSPGDVLVIQLRPHLETLAVGFAISPPPTGSGQLDLFPAQIVDDIRKSDDRTNMESQIAGNRDQRKTA
ncbi:hypothetical protein [Parasphingorhabdus sp.]|uniref:hypothetical protein n=1 Tax=Parasphingorhabdus sp. TaxID=2709688 RepID=UPI003D2C6F97